MTFNFSYQGGRSSLLRRVKETLQHCHALGLLQQRHKKFILELVYNKAFMQFPPTNSQNIGNIVQLFLSLPIKPSTHETHFTRNKRTLRSRRKPRCCSRVLYKRQCCTNLEVI